MILCSSIKVKQGINAICATLMCSQIEDPWIWGDDDDYNKPASSFKH